MPWRDLVWIAVVACTPAAPPRVTPPHVPPVLRRDIVLADWPIQPKLGEREPIYVFSMDPPDVALTRPFVKGAGDARVAKDYAELQRSLQELVASHRRQD